MLVCFAVLLAFVLLIFLCLAWRKVSNESVVEEGDLLGGKGNRMFDFLHTLGIAIEEDHSAARLHQEIVDGIVTLVSAEGGAIYLLDHTQKYLMPKCISADCPLLIDLPKEVYKNVGNDKRALKSQIELIKVPIGRGMLGESLQHGSPQLLVEEKKKGSPFYEENSGKQVTVMVSPLMYGGKDLGVLAVASAHEQQAFNDNEFALFKSASEQAGFALGNAMIHREASEKRTIESELRTAREVQQILLPRTQPQVNGYTISGVNRPARLISGDYYDYIPLTEGKCAVVIADVSGKGVAAGLLMAMCRSVLRAELARTLDPLEAVVQLNRQLFSDIREDAFISLALYVIDASSSKVQLVRAGHDKAPLLRHDAKEVEWIKPPGLAIGLDEGSVFERVTRLHEFEMHAGDLILLYTDGVTEAQNAEEEEFGAERMVKVMRQSASEDTDTLLENMLESLHSFVGESIQSDDITMVALRKS